MITIFILNIYKYYVLFCYTHVRVHKILIIFTEGYSGGEKYETTDPQGKEL